MAIQNVSQHEQQLKLLESSIRTVDVFYQQIVDSHKQMDHGLHELSNLIFRLFLIANDLRETRLEFEKHAQES